MIEIDTIQKLVSHLWNLFGPIKTKAILYLDTVENHRKLILEFAKANKYSLFNISYMGKSSKSCDVLSFFETFDGCKSLNLNTSMEEKLPNDLEIHTEYLTINGDCLTLDNLWNMKCKHLKLNMSNFENNDLNKYLKDWKSGAKENLELGNLIIPMKFINWTTVLSGIAHIEMNQKLQHREFFSMF